jgi:hypothetical protein
LVICQLYPVNGNNILRKGFITELSEVDEFKFISKISRSINLRQKKNINLTVMITYNCYFRCEYCFERYLQAKPKEWLSQVINRDIVDASFAQLAKYRDDGYHLDAVGLLGGEPLLYKNRDIVEYICNKADELSIPKTCISNGYEIDKYMDIIKNTKLDRYKLLLME